MSRPSSNSNRPTLVELGTVIRTHALKGAIVIYSPAGMDCALGYLKAVFLGHSPEKLSAFSVIESSWMPKGWILKLQGLNTLELARAWVGTKIFALREALKPPQAGEYYICDLVGCQVYDANTERPIGQISGIEAAEQDRWYVSTPQGTLVVPANQRFIVRVDYEQKRVWVKNIEDLKP
ncbi:MAG: 16S rRNA processing protein RimM [Deltaproteobacteria bacterium]|nr:16S rRNA processing protein RimM [Deltaproteobacteria bacterium]